MGRPSCVVANVLDYDIVVSEFKLRSHFSVHFRNKYLWERYKHPYLPS